MFFSSLRLRPAKLSGSVTHIPSTYNDRLPAALHKVSYIRPFSVLVLIRQYFLERRGEVLARPRCPLSYAGAYPTSLPSPPPFQPLLGFLSSFGPFQACNGKYYSTHTLPIAEQFSIVWLWAYAAGAAVHCLHNLCDVTLTGDAPGASKTRRDIGLQATPLLRPYIGSARTRLDAADLRRPRPQVLQGGHVTITAVTHRAPPLDVRMPPTPNHPELTLESTPTQDSTRLEPVLAPPAGTIHPGSRLRRLLVAHLELSRSRMSTPSSRGWILSTTSTRWRELSLLEKQVFYPCQSLVPSTNVFQANG